MRQPLLQPRRKLSNRLRLVTRWRVRLVQFKHAARYGWGGRVSIDRRLLAR